MQSNVFCSIFVFNNKHFDKPSQKKDNLSIVSKFCECICEFSKYPLDIHKSFGYRCVENNRIPQVSLKNTKPLELHIRFFLDTSIQGLKKFSFILFSNNLAIFYVYAFVKVESKSLLDFKKMTKENDMFMIYPKKSTFLTSIG